MSYGSIPPICVETTRPQMEMIYIYSWFRYFHATIYYALIATLSPCASMHNTNLSLATFYLGIAIGSSFDCIN